MPPFRFDSPSLEALTQRADARFAERYGREARWLVAAPGRVNLIGEHTDYNGGFVLPMAIDRHVVLAADTVPGCEIECYSTTLNESGSFRASLPLTAGEPRWTNYLRGVVAGFLQRGTSVPGFECVIENDLPLGGGLSSSAALEVSTATLIEALTGSVLEPLDKIRLCQQAEHEFAGVPCGIMDQFTSTLGRRGAALLIDCASESALPVTFDSSEIAVLIINSNVHHELVGSPYAERRAQCRDAALALEVTNLRMASSHRLEAFRDRMTPLVYRRARHVVSENERTTQMAHALAQQDWCTAGDLMVASHASMRDDFEISCIELDLLVELARSLGHQAGVYGSRMTGGGFGGCSVSLVRRERAAQVGAEICAAYHQKTGIMPDWFITEPADGAGVLRRPSQAVPAVDASRPAASIAVT